MEFRRGWLQNNAGPRSPFGLLWGWPWIWQGVPWGCLMFLACWHRPWLYCLQNWLPSPSSPNSGNDHQVDNFWLIFSVSRCLWQTSHWQHCHGHSPPSPLQLLSSWHILQKINVRVKKVARYTKVALYTSGALIFGILCTILCSAKSSKLFLNIMCLNVPCCK